MVREGLSEGLTIAVLAALLLVWSLVARRVDRWGITPPIAFLVAGVLLVGLREVELSREVAKLLAEITLVLVLFHDASTVRLADLRRDPWIAVRLLAVGFPLALLATAATAAWLLPAAGVAGAVLIAASITPTDAGLGAPTVLNPVVPVRVRRALNVESGLNDGLATPLVLAMLGILAEQGDTAGPLPTVLTVGAVPVLLGLGLGIGLGLGGAWAVDRSRDRDWSSVRGRGLAVLMLPGLAFGLAELTGGNGFIAAFVGGLVFGRASVATEVEHEVSEPLEITADLLGYLVWFVAGGLVVASLENGLRWQWVVIAVAALTVLRAGPVALSLAGLGFRAPTVLFLGWFGPRGLATIVFGLLSFEELAPDEPLLADVAGVLTLTVLLSVVAHGVSATPLSVRYGGWVRRTHAPIETEPSVEPMPSRGRSARAE
jgi:NhaP-type Na+/H+ or K+/H+ antiporter